MRQEGYYFVRYKGEWVIAKFYAESKIWILFPTGIMSYLFVDAHFYDSDFDEINETQVTIEYFNDRLRQEKQLEAIKIAEANIKLAIETAKQFNKLLNFKQIELDQHPICLPNFYSEVSKKVIYEFSTYLVKNDCLGKTVEFRFGHNIITGEVKKQDTIGNITFWVIEGINP